MALPSSLPLRRLPLLAAALALLLGAVASVSAAPAVSVAGTYDSEGTTVQTESGYDGPVSLRGLLALDFDFAGGVRLHSDITAIEIAQDEKQFSIRALKEDAKPEWSAKWLRNGGFEATPDGVKFLIRPARKEEHFFMFTASLLNNGAALLIKIERIQSSPTGPVGAPIGTFLFLRAADAAK